jgi:predicted small lipoprotein YifL
MKLRRIIAGSILAIVLVMAGYFSMNAANASGPYVAAPAATVAPPDAQPDSEVAAADVPIAGVAPEAAGVNEGTSEQASGIKMTSDNGKGLDGDDVSDSALAGGCLPGYGGDGVCLPPIPPRLVKEHAGHAGMIDSDMALFYTCEDVHALIPKGIAVQDRDWIGLDTNGDGVACGKGDTK